jgi:hypothetical protein
VTDPLPFPKRRRRWRPWLLGLGLSLLLMLAIGAAAYLYWRQGVHRRLAEALAELDATDPGWRLADIEKARADVPEDENSARVTVAVNRLLPEKWPAPDFAEPFDELPAGVRLDAEQLARLAKGLEEARPAVEEARKLVDLPRGRHRITYLRNPLETRLEDQQRVRQVVALLEYDSLRLAHDGQADDAVHSCRAELNAARSLGDEPFMVSQLIRIACVHRACRAAERVLGLGEPGPAVLAKLQRLLEDEDRHPGLLIAARGERGVDQALFDAFESGEMTLGELSGPAGARPSWRERVYGFAMRDLRRAEHPLMLALMSRRVAEVRELPSHEQVEAGQAFEAEARGLPPGAVFTRLLLPAVSKIGEADRRKHAHVRSLVVLLAAERYRRAKGRWPESLAQMVPDYLSAASADPYDGAPLRYRRLDDGVVAYAVGADRVDDGGSIGHKLPDEPGADVGHRLWDVGHRRQPPGPAPDHEGERP